jgi:uncharacterized membrane protein
MLQEPIIQVFAIIALAVALLYNGLRDGSHLAWFVFLLISIASFVAAYIDIAIYLLYLPPIIIPLLLWSVFFRSLLPGQEAIITDIGERARGPLTVEMRRYTRIVTIIWTVLFALMAAWSAILPWAASENVWSLFTNFINYAIVGILFFAEFQFRKIRFREHDHPNFFQYVRIVINANIRKS